MLIMPIQSNITPKRCWARLCGPRRKKTPQWLMTGVDAEGCDLRRCGETPHLYFAHTVATMEEMRAELAHLTGKTK
jgi:hypothetical protein